MMRGMFLARGRTLFAGFDADFGQRRCQAGILCRQILHCTAKGEHLVDRCGAVFHGSVAFAQQRDAVCQANLSGGNAVACSFAGGFVGIVGTVGGMGMAAVVVVAAANEMAAVPPIN